MNSKSLFFQRLRQNWIYQYNIFKTVADWIVMLYTFIPGALIAFVIYRSWWIEIPAWIELIPFSLMFALLFLFISSGHFRTFVREADQIFLMKKRSLYIGLKRNGIFYSYGIQILITALLGLLIAPFWLNYYQTGMVQLFSYLGLFLSSKWLIMGVKSNLSVHLRGWRSLIRGIPIFIGIAIIWILFYQAFQVNQILIMIGFILLNIAGSIFLVRKRFNSVSNFEQDLAIDEAERTKYIGLIFSISMDIEKPSKPASSRNNPILYSESNRLFRKRSARNGFIELFIKVNTRNAEYILRYLQIIGVTSLAVVLIPPVWFKIAIGLFGLLFVRTWIINVWDQVIGNHSFSMKYANKDGYLTGKRRVTFIVCIVYLILISLSFIVRSLI